ADADEEGLRQDPFTMEKISTEKLHSPQIIYLPRYIADSKHCLEMILRRGKWEFDHPFIGQAAPLSEDNRNAITKQIREIFHITILEFRSCFEFEVENDRLQRFTELTGIRYS
ncbi:MAG: hypothetical protein K1060chlam2_00092, partial [Chlamydiae bacterium]|nr:hypothetical protein [Chlamydiota bacterium]